MNIFIKELKNTGNNSILIKKIRMYYDSLRVKEILLIGGVTFIGLIFNPNKFVPGIFLDWIFIMLSSYTLLGHSFTANDWSGYYYDRNDINKMNRPLVKGEMSLTEIKILSLTLLFVSMVTICNGILFIFIYSSRNSSS
jgi:4-hydroxybenzoate polyprenyltransferase